MAKLLPVILIALFSLSPTIALADTSGTAVSGVGSQCSNDTMGMSQMPAGTSSHHGYRLDYVAGGSTSNHNSMTLTMGLSDAGTNQTISFATYIVKIDRINQTAFNTAQNNAVVNNVLGSNVFLARSGNLTLNLKMVNSSSQSVQPIVYGDQDPVLNAYVADPGRGITIGNLPMGAGAYRAHVELFGVDTAQCIFSGSDTPKFDVYWNLDANGAITQLGSSTVPEFGISQVILVLSISAIIGATLVMRTRQLL